VWPYVHCKGVSKQAISIVFPYNFSLSRWPTNRSIRLKAKQYLSVHCDELVRSRFTIFIRSFNVRNVKKSWISWPIPSRLGILLLKLWSSLLVASVTMLGDASWSALLIYTNTDTRCDYVVAMQRATRGRTTIVCRFIVSKAESRLYTIRRYANTASDIEVVNSSFAAFLRPTIHTTTWSSVYTHHEILQSCCTAIRNDHTF
jgi:hypothetical protein